jgi:hypothetical protein
MSDDFKLYSFSNFWFFLACLNVVLALIVSILNFLHPFPNLAYLFIAIGWLITASLWVGHIIHAKNYPAIVTFDNKIIISRGAYMKMIEINISNILKIERKSLTKIIIHHQDKQNKPKKRKVSLSYIDGKDQIKFNGYIEKLIEQVSFSPTPNAAP